MGNYILHNGELYHYGVKGMRWGVRKTEKWANSEHQPSSVKSSALAGLWAATGNKRIAKALEKSNDVDAQNWERAKKVHNLNSVKKIANTSSRKDVEEIFNKNKMLNDAVERARPFVKKLTDAETKLYKYEEDISDGVVQRSKKHHLSLLKDYDSAFKQNGAAIKKEVDNLLGEYGDVVVNGKVFKGGAANELTMRLQSQAFSRNFRDRK